MRRRRFLAFSAIAAAQIAVASIAHAKDGDDDASDDHEDDHDGQDDHEDNHDSEDHHPEDNSGDDGGGDDGGDGGGGDDGTGSQSSGSSGDDDDDHERAYDAVAAGEAIPLKQLLTIFDKDYDGTIVDVTLVHGSRLRYRIRFYTSMGRVRSVYYDARTGRRLR